MVNTGDGDGFWLLACLLLHYNHGVFGVGGGGVDMGLNSATETPKGS